MYIMSAMTICLLLETQVVFFAASFARANTGNRIAARMAIIAMTTRSSIRVNPFVRRFMVLPVYPNLDQRVKMVFGISA